MLPQIINVMLGIWIMSSPEVLEFSDSTATDNNHIVGPLIVTFAFTALWEATRTVGHWNIALGTWLVIGPWILSFGDTTALINDMAVGVLITIFALIRGKITQKFGGGWISLFQSNPEHVEKAKEVH